MRVSCRSVSIVTALAASSAAASMLILSACSPAAANKPADRQTPPATAKLAGPVRLDVPEAAPVEPAKRVGSNASVIPPPPKVSTFAPAEDLVRQADQYIKGLEAIVADEEEYKDGREKIGKDANTLIVIALALGLHDQDNSYKANAGAVMKAAGELAAAVPVLAKGELASTKDLAAARKAVAALRDAAEGKGKPGGELKWEKVASLPELMKQVPLINTKLKRNIKPEKFKKKAKDTAGYTAVIAAVAQGSVADLSETKNPAQVKQWHKFMTAMRDDAGEANAAIHKRNEPAAAKAMKKLAQSCEDCHAVFHPGVKIED